jgi:ketosteroid isomerase-like protein
MSSSPSLRAVAYGLLVAFSTGACSGSGAPASTAAVGRTDQATEAAILELDRAWGQAYVKDDIDFVDRILAADWRGWTDHEGSDKASELAEFRAGRSRALENIIDNARVRIYGNTAVVEARERMRYRDEAGEHWLTWHITDVFVRSGEQWQVVTSHQSTVPNL